MMQQKMNQPPKDPFMLLSWTNMKLRDFYTSLDNLCDDLEIDGAELKETLRKIGYEYMPEENRFR